MKAKEENPRTSIKRQREREFDPPSQATTRSMTNRKTSRGTARRSFGFGHNVFNIGTHLTLDRRQEAVDFGWLALDDKLDTAVGKVAHMTRDPEATRQRLAGVAKPHSLNPARVEQSPTIPRHKDPPRGSRASINLGLAGIGKQLSSSPTS
jgi:hypothetical protein